MEVLSTLWKTITMEMMQYMIENNSAAKGFTFRGKPGRQEVDQNY